MYQKSALSRIKCQKYNEFILSYSMKIVKISSISKRVTGWDFRLTLHIRML